MTHVQGLKARLVKEEERALGPDHKKLPEYHKHRLFRSTPLRTSGSTGFTGCKVSVHQPGWAFSSQPLAPFHAVSDDERGMLLPVAT